jgi:hypothetical protein
MPAGGPRTSTTRARAAVSQPGRKLRAVLVETRDGRTLEVHDEGDPGGFPFVLESRMREVNEWLLSHT